MAYDNGFIDVLVAEAPVFRRPGWEAASDDDKPVGKQKRYDADRQDLLRAVRRAKAKVRQIAMANAFDWFVTLTLDPGKVDRFDEKTIIRKMSKWCENQVARGGLRYVLIPERHKDGAIHFHGFFSWDKGGRVVESGTYIVQGSKKPRKPRSERERLLWAAEGAKPVYNLPAWSLGFTTAIAVYGDYGSAVGYVCKYIGKQMEDGKIGGRWYYSGGKLLRPSVGYCDLDLQDLDSVPGVYDFTVPAVGKMRLWRGPADRFAALMGPLLQERAFSDFLERFYPENGDKIISCEISDGNFDPEGFVDLPDDLPVPFS